MNDNRHAQRQLIGTERSCALGIFTFKQLNWQNLDASIVDISSGGVGIELNAFTEPGIVWFKDRIFGKQSGVLLWSKQVGSQYRSGIRFASLSRELEQFVNNNSIKSDMREPLKDLHHIVALQLESLKTDPENAV
jgi:hypothetical protein